ncbi:pPIWI_RE module domain-containing protein [Gloeothece verrucosa]|uniref:pPIWI-RE module N-terminal domain-containing protein n=1 Tax=Gloeothece verrucosa (strain PCC 7822) TaxID=497965 RepID=E0UG53_GLOV7|nr:DUF3962 domain-containing protein [Gloeothece verrucosa]ADN15554.1 hypothetical protein Cyan7822_3614 [Gloeothece verrucosa PCC 7822]
MKQKKNVNLNYLQPIYLDYTESLTENISGYIMPFPNIERFNQHYGKPHENARTSVLEDIMRLLLPQIRVINKPTVNRQPNPAAFLAYTPVDPQILALLFKIWVEVCYPASQHTALMPFCQADQFHWLPATAEDLKFWAPSWVIAVELTKHEYQIGDYHFKLLFGPGRQKNTVELVSWPPRQNIHGHRTSIAIIISTQSDLAHLKVNLHFQMKRWIVKQGNTPEVRLEDKTTRCYVRRLRSWLGDYTLLEPNAFTVIEAHYRKEKKGYVTEWKSPIFREMLQRLEVANVLPLLHKEYLFPKILIWIPLNSLKLC